MGAKHGGGDIGLLGGSCVLYAVWRDYDELPGKILYGGILQAKDPSSGNPIYILDAVHGSGQVWQWGHCMDRFSRLHTTTAE